ncbi:MAG: carboxylating nicotinate-nucleotide diphosphorylase [Thermoleophilia bacterium]
MAGENEEIGRQALRHIVSLALDEDLDSLGDITSKAIFGPDDAGAARVVSREACVLSGLAAAVEVCLQVDPELIWLPLVEDGQAIPAAAEVARLEGRIISILAAERTILNFLSRLSGIASLTARYVNAVTGTTARIAATRKTSPGLRLLEKLAVVDGGGEPHRSGLYDAVLIKDNHIAAAGGVGAAIEAVRRTLEDRISDRDIEVEVDNIAQLEEALASGAIGQVLLDNMTTAEVRACHELAVARTASWEQKPVIEVSGGVSLENVRAYAEAGADVISVGALTRSAAGIDFSLETA